MPPSLARYEASHMAMGTEFTLVSYGHDGQFLAEVGQEVFDEIDRLEAQLSKFDPKSQISVINRNAGQGSVRVEPKLFELLADSIEYSRSTGGAFDMTAGPLMRAWGFFHGQGRIPTRFEIDEVMQRVGYRHMHLNRDNRSVQFDFDGIELDLGAIGKGYAIDSAVEILRRYGVSRALISGGTSSIYALGAPPGERAWSIQLRDPYRKEEAAETVRISNAALSTSGNYEKFFESANKKYAHILDPATGNPVENMLATIVIAPTACASDALSTAFYVMGVQRTREYLADKIDLTAIFYLPKVRKREFQRLVLRSAKKSLHRISKPTNADSPAVTRKPYAVRGSLSGGSLPKRFQQPSCTQ